MIVKMSKCTGIRAKVKMEHIFEFNFQSDSYKIPPLKSSPNLSLSVIGESKKDNKLFLTVGKI